MKRFQNMISSLFSGTALVSSEAPIVTTEGGVTLTDEQKVGATVAFAGLAAALGVTAEQLVADLAAEDPKAAFAAHFEAGAPDEAALAAAREEGRAEGEAAGREAARTETNAQAQAAERTAQADRIKAVFALESSKGRERSAARLLQTTMSVEDIDATLADLPQGDEAAALAALAASTPNPQLGTGGEQQKQTRAENNHGWNNVISRLTGQKID